MSIITALSQSEVPRGEPRDIPQRTLKKIQSFYLCVIKKGEGGQTLSGMGFFRQRIEDVTAVEIQSNE